MSFGQKRGRYDINWWLVFTVIVSFVWAENNGSCQPYSLIDPAADHIGQMKLHLASGDLESVLACAQSNLLFSGTARAWMNRGEVLMKILTTRGDAADESANWYRQAARVSFVRALALEDSPIVRMRLRQMFLTDVSLTDFVASSWICEAAASSLGTESFFEPELAVRNTPIVLFLSQHFDVPSANRLLRCVINQGGIPDPVALHVTVVNGDMEGLQLLLQHGANANSQLGSWPLLMTALCNTPVT